MHVIQNNLRTPQLAGEAPQLAGEAPQLAGFTQGSTHLHFCVLKEEQLADVNLSLLYSIEIARAKAKRETNDKCMEPTCRQASLLGSMKLEYESKSVCRIVDCGGLVV